MKRDAKNGFSLIEILIVITIIGILMALIIPTYKGITSKARAVKCQANLKNLHTAVMLYNKDRSRYPWTFSRVWEDEGGDIDQASGWVVWSSDADKYEVFNNPALGLTDWMGTNGQRSVTSGTIWSYTGKSIECYACPEFKIAINKQSGINSDAVLRTYVMNRALDDRNIFTLKNMSSTLLFGEGAISILFSPEGDGDKTALGNENENKWDGCFMPGEYSHGHFSRGRNSEVLGHYHKDKTSYIVFCDGHIEKVRKVNDEDVLFDLCEGVILKRNEF